MKRALLIVVLALVLSACGGRDNKDPRDGRVTIDESNCLFGNCYWDYKVCSGPDMVYHVNKKDHVVENHPDCVVFK